MAGVGKQLILCVGSLLLHSFDMKFPFVFFTQKSRSPSVEVESGSVLTAMKLVTETTLIPKRPAPAPPVKPKPRKVGQTRVYKLYVYSSVSLLAIQFQFAVNAICSIILMCKMCYCVCH